MANFSSTKPIRLQRKEFQEQALATLSRYLEASRKIGVPQAFRSETGMPYQSEPFGEKVPCVCLRIPTGGGKTVLGARAVPVIAEWYGGADAPVVIWLVPSEAILMQTLAALSTDGHPYREQLAKQYGSRLLICNLEDVPSIPEQDWGQRAIVIVTTMQSFNVEKTDKRRVYSFSESFEAHFKSKSPSELQVLNGLDGALVTEANIAEIADDPERQQMLTPYIGKPKQSLANWLALHNPILIVDEAHNAKTEKSFVTLSRLNPAAALELTATPIAGKINVLYHVSALQLQAESMIKMPIMLAEHKEGWEKAVLAAVHTRGGLADAALKEQAAGHGYIRPIVLFQAMNEGREVPPEKLREHLQSELKIPAEEIAVATGNTRELEDQDLSSPDCRINYIITVQALREGWDCPFAYVLCSLQNLSSSTAVEQLLGRVLRMPYATARGEAALNRAYAHVCEANTGYAAKALADRLVDSLGFDPLDVAAMLVQNADSPQLALDQGNWTAQALVREQAIVTPINVDVPQDAELPVCVERRVDASGRPVVVLRGYVDEDAVERIVSASKSKKEKAAIREEIVRHNAVTVASSSPANLGLPFANLPRLAFRESSQGKLQLLEREIVMEDVELDLLNVSAIDLGRFDLAAQSETFEISADDRDGHIVYHRSDPAQIPLNYGATHLATSDIARWLDQMLYMKTPFLTKELRQAYFSAVLHRLVNVHNYSVGQLAEARYVLARRLLSKIEDLRNAACKVLFRQAVLDGGWSIEIDWHNLFSARSYPAPAGTRYNGRFRFNKNYYGAVIADLKSDGEEFDCLVEIDRHPRVKSWIRNLDFPPGFALPTSRGRFFPDFLLELVDGTVVVIEYKGQHLRSDPYEIEKREVGRIWARATNGKCRFDYVFKTGDSNESLAEQITALLA
jgi:type III restriction enzyme